uniref:Ig-like domain-containing protein n=1 Tax=Cyanoderma ruficeps TaxID=181631 RepID=A0A8C3QGQ9_9PASS
MVCADNEEQKVTETQNPSSVTANVGDSVKINSPEGNSKRYFEWCQQKVPGSGPVTVIYTDNKRPSGSSNTLTNSGVQAEDEAVYFCGGDDSSSGSWNGDTEMLCRRRPWGCAGPGIAVSQPHHLILLPDTSSYLAKSLHEAKALGSRPWALPEAVIPRFHQNLLAQEPHPAGQRGLPWGTD